MVNIRLTDDQIIAKAKQKGKTVLLAQWIVSGVACADLVPEPSVLLSASSLLSLVRDIRSECRTAGVEPLVMGPLISKMT